MGKIILYGVNASPFVRACLLTLKALELPYEYHVVDMAAGENMSEEYLAKNPQHTVPTLEDEDGKCIWDSHAIIAYLVNKYAKSDRLYSRDYYEKARIDQRLHLDSDVVSQALRNVMLPVYFKNETQVSKENIDGIIAVYDKLEKLLGNDPYMAGDHLTIADFSLIASVTSLALLWPIDADKYVKLSAWVKRLEALPYYEEGNAKGLAEYKTLMTQLNVTVSY